MTDMIIFSIMIFAAYGVGKRLLDLLVKDTGSALEGFIFSAGLGLGILGYTIYVIGSTGFLYPKVAVTVLFIYALFSLSPSIRLIRGVKWNKLKAIIIGLSFFEKFLLSMLVIIPSICIFGAMAPETGCDSLAYHLNHPRIFIQAHRIGYIPFTRESLWPYLTEMLFTLGLLFKSVTIAKLFHYFFGILSVLSVYSFTRRFFTRKEALLAAALFYSAPGIFMQSVYSYVDLSLCFYSFAALYAMILWSERHDLKFIALSGIFTGLALSVKLLGGLTLIALLCVIFFILMKEKPGSFSIGKSLFVFCGVSFLFSFIWYARSYIVLNNPVYPFLHTVFHSGFICDAGGTYGLRKDIIGMARLPWDLVMRSASFGNEQIGIVSLAFLPFLFFAPIRDKRVRCLSVFLYAYLIQWFMVDQNVRFAFVIFAVTYILISVGFYHVAKRYRLNIAAILISFCILFNVSLCAYYNRDALMLGLGFINKESYLMRNEQTYPVAKFVNEKLPKNSVLILVGEPRHYYFDGNILFYDLWKLVSRETIAHHVEELTRQGVPAYILNRSDVDYPEIKEIVSARRPAQNFSTNPRLENPFRYYLYKL